MSMVSFLTDGLSQFLAVQPEVHGAVDRIRDLSFDAAYADVEEALLLSWRLRKS
jgi:hypothetical protein